MSDHFIEDISQLNDTEIGKGLALEREAQQFHARGEIDKAFASYDRAANFYREMGEHLKAAMCYAAAATCWNIHTADGSLSKMRPVAANMRPRKR